jgi:hypothetical protein
MTQLIMKDKIQALKEAVSSLPQEQIPTQHFLFNGIYIRQTFISRGIFFVGRVHKVDHVFMVLKGSAEVTVDEQIHKLVSGMTLLCTPGTRRAGITLEDTVFAGVYRTDKTDIKDIQEEIVESVDCLYDENNRVISQLHDDIRQGRSTSREQWENSVNQIYLRSRKQEATWYGLT